jgi:glyoxalase family protein
MKLSLERAATVPLASLQVVSYMIPEKPQMSAPGFPGKSPEGLYNAANRNSPSDGDFGKTARQSGVLYQPARHAAGEENRQSGRRQRLPSVLRRRQSQPRDGPDFFDFPAAPERRGTNSISRTGLRVAGENSLGYWRDRLKKAGGHAGDVVEVDGRLTLPFEDGEGQRLVLVDDGGTGPASPWERSAVPAEHQIRGLGPIVLNVPDLAPTAHVLTEVMNMRRLRDYAAPDAGARIHVFAMGEGGPAAELHVIENKDLSVARQGAGGVHHVAFRTPDEAQYHAWTQRLTELRVPNSGEIDRFYFRSLYFREPNGILFEIATDGPGFATDEPMDTLGERLALPPFLESRRAAIEAGLKPLG